MKFPSQGPRGSSRIGGVMEVCSLSPVGPSQSNIPAVNGYHHISAVVHWVVDWLVQAHQVLLNALG